MRDLRYFRLGLAVFLTGCLWGSSPAQQAPATNTSQSGVETRVRQLEVQIEALQAELGRIKQELAASQAAPSPAPAQAEAPKPAAESKPQPGIDLGAVRATPYGTLYFNAFGDSDGTNNSDVPLFAAPTGSGGTGASVRQTRFGLRLAGPKIGRARSSGVVEADFFGGFPAIGIGENFGVVRLRLANFRLDWEKTTLVVGQDWAVFAPVNPVSLAAAAIPQMAAAGNPWTRLPQLRLERQLARGRLLWQGAIVAPNTGDFPSGTNSPALLQPGAGSSAKLPAGEVRLAVREANWWGTKKAGGIGVSAHYGRARVTGPSGTRRVDVLGLALDWQIPLGTRLTWAGEAFAGRNLAAFQAGVFQNINPDFAYLRGATRVPGGPRAIGTRGGWSQIGWTPPALRDRLTLYGSFGMDDPRDGDLVSLSPKDWRQRNQVWAFNWQYKVTPNTKSRV